MLEHEVDPDPLLQLGRWLAEAAAAGARLPEAMALATATLDGRPSVRMVLLKGFDERGFSFYSGTESRKGRELAANPRAALCFYWGELGRQARVEGAVAPLPPEESYAYFSTRPLGSRLGAWTSRQSEVISDRGELEARLAEVTARFAGADPPLPPAWGGYLLVPELYELWEHREDRLHDRLRYTRRAAGAWTIERLSP